MKHRIIFLALFSIITFSTFSFPNVLADFTISFNVSCTTISPTNCQDITLSVGTTADNTPFREFRGDAQGTGWLKTGTFPAWNNLAIQPNGTAGEFTMTIEGGTVDSQPLSLQFKVQDIDATFLNDISSSGFLDYDPWIVPITHTSNTSPPTFTLDYARLVRFQNPAQFTITGNYTFKIEHRVRFLDGISGISGGDQLIAFQNFTFTNTNKGNAVLSTFVSDTTTLTTSTKEFIRLNAVFYDRIRGNLGAGSSFTFTSPNYPRIEYQSYYDDVNFGNNWNKATIINLVSGAGTFADPTGSGETDLLRDFIPRSRWNFDFPQNTPNSSVNPDGYEGWTFQTGFGNRTNNDQGTSGCTISPFCSITHTITRTTAVSEPSFPSGAFTPKSIQSRVVAEGGSNTACGGSAPLNNDTNELVRMRERLFLTNAEDLKFVIHHRLIATADNIPTDDCDFNATQSIRLVDPDGNVLTTITMSDVHFENLANDNPVNTAWQLEISLPSSLSDAYTFLDVDIQWRITNKTGVCASTSGGCTVTYNFYMDSYASNWVNFVDSTGGDCTLGEDCTPKPPPVCMLFPQLCVPPPQQTFCQANPTHVSCIGNITTTNPCDQSTDPFCLGTTPTGGVRSIGTVPVICSSGSINWTAININNNATAVIDATQFMANLFAFIGCAPNFLIPLATLFMGIAMFVIPLGERGIIPVLVFIIAWGLMFSFFGFFPFWIAIIIAIGAIAGLIFGIKKSTGSE